MSRHVPRHERWISEGPDRYRSVDGLVVRRKKGEWWAEVVYQLSVEPTPEDPAGWERHHDRLGPFRRPRNAMVEAERHAVQVRNRHGDQVQFIPWMDNLSL